MTPAVVAHTGGPVGPHDVLAAWPLDPMALAGLVTGALLYGRGYVRIRRGEAGRRAVPAWRVWCFAGGLVVVTAAVATPLEPLSRTLFGAHMLQHLLLGLLAPPLLVLGRPALVCSLALAPRLRRVVASARGAVLPAGRDAAVWAVAAVAAHAASFWAWHLPGLYELALRDDVVHALDHLTLLGGGVAFWWLVADARGRHANAVGVLAIFAGALQSTALAGLITFAPRPWYGVHAAGAAAWGLTPLDDQHVAGGLMWFPGGLAYMIAGAALFLRWLREDERAADYRTAAGRAG